MDSFQFFGQSFIHQPKKHTYMINYKLAIHIFLLQNQNKPNLDIHIDKCYIQQLENKIFLDSLNRSNLTWNSHLL